MRPFKVLCIFILIFASSNTLRAQNAVSTGGISGIVTDASGALIPGVAVEATNLATGVHLHATTNSSGLYAYPALSIGDYSVRFTAAGFSTEVVPLVRVSIGNSTSVGARLQVGSTSQEITVSETTENILNTSESSVSTTVNRKLIDNLPLSGRNYTDFVLLTPGATPDGEFGDVSFAGQQASGSSGYANGNGSNSFTVDGASATSSFFGGARGRTRVPYVFGEESIQQFQVSDNPYSAAYGSGGAGFVNTVTKSGTNQMHGGAFYYNRNSGTASNDAIDQANGIPTPLDVLQQFGANAGGPIVKNQLFYFFDYEQQRLKDPISVINTGQQGLDVTNFGLPAGTVLPAPNANFPVPAPAGVTETASASDPFYLQQVANALGVIQGNIGSRQRRQDDLLFFPKVDWQLGQNNHFTFVYNYNKFDSPGGEITFNPVAFAGVEALSNNNVRDHHADIHFVHNFNPNLLNEVYVSYLRDQQIETPSGLAPTAGFPTVSLFSPEFFELGNPGFALGNTRETEVEFNDHLTYVRGRHMFTAGFDYNHDGVTDFNYGNFRGTYAFTSPENFALMHWLFFSQSAGNPTFIFGVPYYGMYVNDKYKVASNVTLDLGVREDFQKFPQPQANPAIPLTGQFHNTYQHVAPRLGISWAVTPKTVIRGGFGVFYTIFNGSNYENSTISNGLPNQQSSVQLSYGSTNAPTFPNQITSSSLFSASSNVSVIAPDFKPPVIYESSLQVEQAFNANTTFSIGTIWSHAVHLISSSAYDLNLNAPQGTTTFIVCPVDTPSTAGSCAGQSYTAPTLDNGLLTEGATNPNVGQINEMISPGLNQYNSLIAQFTHRTNNGLQVLSSFTYSKNMDSNGVDFNNQFSFANTHSPSLLDQRIRLSVSAVYQSHGTGLTSALARDLAKDWTISTVMAFNSGRPYTGLLNPACTGPNLQNCNGAGDNLNDSAFNQTTNNTALGIAGAGPSPDRGYSSYYGPWIDEVDIGLERRFMIHNQQYLSITAQVFNVTNHQNYFVQSGSGVNQIQYTPMGTNCGDGASQNQTCYLMPNVASSASSSYFGQLESIDQLNPPRVFQFAFRYGF